MSVLTMFSVLALSAIAFSVLAFSVLTMPTIAFSVLSPENQAIVDWTVKGLQGSDGLCKKTKVEVNNFSTQVVAGTMYEFDLVLDHAEDSAAECGAPDGLREVCHMAVWEKVWEDFR